MSKPIKISDRLYMGVIEVDNIRPNNWNINVQTESTFNKLKLSLDKHEMNQSLTLLKDYDEESGTEFIILNGEHRWRAAKDLGLEVVPALFYIDMTPEEAIQITLKSNELNGDPDIYKLPERLEQTGLTKEQILEEFEWSKSELENIFSIGDTFDEEEFIMPDTDMSEEEEELLDAQNRAKVRLSFMLDQKQFNEFYELKRKLDCLTDDDAFIKLCFVCKQALNKNKVKDIIENEPKKSKKKSSRRKIVE